MAVPSSEPRPQPRHHRVEPLQLQSAKLLRLLDGLLTKGAESRTDVAMRGVYVNTELSGDLAVRSAGLP